MNIEKAITIDSRTWLGLIVLRVLSPKECDIVQYKTDVIAHLRKENDYEHRGRDVIDGELNDLMEAPIIYYQTTKVTIPEIGHDLNYVQLVLDCGMKGSHTDMIRDIAGYVYNLGYNPDWVISRNPTNMFFTINNICPNRNSYISLMIGPSLPTEDIRRTFSFVNDMAIKFDLKNPTQVIKQGTPYKVIIYFYDSIVKAIEDKNSRTIVISTFQNDGSGLLHFGQYREIISRQFVYKQHYEEKMKAKIANGILIIYDGEKSLKCIEPYLGRLAAYKINMVDILQFSHHKDFFYQDNLRDGMVRKIVFHFINQDKISYPRSRFGAEGRSLMTNVCYMPGKGLKPKHIDIMCHNNRGYVGEFVIPVNDDGVQARVTELVMNYIGSVLTGGNFRAIDFAMAYKGLLFKDEPTVADNDILSEWFKNCVKTNRKTARGIIYAYMNMKEQLEREYNGLKDYVECFDFSKCKPVPSIEMDKKLKKNYYKSLHIEPENIIINKINNKKVKEISQVKPIIRFNYIDSRRMLNMGKMPIYKFYDATTNSLKFEFNKMKGMVAHDKVKNRR